MKSVRLLLPFTHGVDTLALEYAVMLAKSCDATLIPLSLVHVPAHNAGGPRLELIQESKDFLVAVQQKAARQSVPVEPLEVYTSNVSASIKKLAQDTDSHSILLFIQGKEGVLLHLNEIKQTMSRTDSNHHLFHLPAPTHETLPQTLMRPFFSIFSHRKNSRRLVEA